MSATQDASDVVMEQAMEPCPMSPNQLLEAINEALCAADFDLARELAALLVAREDLLDVLPAMDTMSSKETVALVVEKARALSDRDGRLRKFLDEVVAWLVFVVYRSGRSFSDVLYFVTPFDSETLALVAGEEPDFEARRLTNAIHVVLRERGHEQEIKEYPEPRHRRFKKGDAPRKPETVAEFMRAINYNVIEGYHSKASIMTDDMLKRFGSEEITVRRGAFEQCVSTETKMRMFKYSRWLIKYDSQIRPEAAKLRDYIYDVLGSDLLDSRLTSTEMKRLGKLYDTELLRDMDREWREQMVDQPVFGTVCDVFDTLMQERELEEEEVRNRPIVRTDSDSDSD